MCTTRARIQDSNDPVEFIKFLVTSLSRGSSFELFAYLNDFLYSFLRTRCLPVFLRLYKEELRFSLPVFYDSFSSVRL